MNILNRVVQRFKKDKPLALFAITAVVLVFFTVVATFIGLFTIGFGKHEDLHDECISAENPWRLPSSVYPVHYDLELFNMQLHPAWKYDGKVAIHLKSQAKTKCIEMHAEAIEFKSVKLHSLKNGEASSSFTTPKGVERFPELGHRVRWSFGNPLESDGDYLLVVEFNGNIRTDLRGFYQSSYTTPDNVKHYLGVTQFESVFARTVFPCFDEPTFKSSFKLSLTLNTENAERYQIISNTVVDSMAVKGNSKSVTFKKTPVMSTYLLAWVIGEMDSISDNLNIGRNIPVSVYTPLGESEKARYALDVATKVMKEMVNYWDISESILDKMDLVAIPDFEAGAMENWGLLTFRSKYLLLPQNASVSAQNGVALVVAHEVAHQQTGNLYTAKFWNDLWLNEGFANFFEHKLIELAYGSAFNPWKIFLTSVSTSALEKDSVPSSHALTFDANTSIEINGMFSSVTYDKGASVLRMLEEYLGPDKFRTWVRKFAKEHKFKSVVTSDLLKALTDTFPQSDAVHFTTWTDQAGYPLITVEDHGSNVFSLSQSRFWSHEPIGGDEKKQLWWVPITYQSFEGESSIKSFSLFTKRSTTFQTSLLTVNVGRSGLYRVNYPKKHWEKLAKHISENTSPEAGALPTMKLSVADRFGLVDDVIALGRSGYLRIGVMLEFLQAFKFERELAIWDPIISRLMNFQILLGSEPSYNAFCRYIHDLLYNVYNYVGWDEDPSETNDKKQLRALVLKLLIKTNYRPAVKEILERHNNGQTLSRNIRGLAFDTIVREGGELGFAEVEALFRASSDEDRITYASALLSSDKPSLLKKALTMFIIEGMVRAQDGPYVVKYVSDNIYAINLGWDFALENIESLQWVYGDRIFMNKIIPGFASRFSTKVRYKEIERYLSVRPGFSKLALDGILDQIRSNMHFRDFNFYDISVWLREKGFDNPPIADGSS